VSDRQGVGVGWTTRSVRVNHGSGWYKKKSLGREDDRFRCGGHNAGSSHNELWKGDDRRHHSKVMVHVHIIRFSLM
jgi:hypothetical protein